MSYLLYHQIYGHVYENLSRSQSRSLSSRADCNHFWTAFKVARVFKKVHYTLNSYVLTSVHFRQKPLSRFSSVMVITQIIAANLSWVLDEVHLAITPFFLYWFYWCKLIHIHICFSVLFNFLSSVLNCKCSAQLVRLVHIQ